MDDNPAAAVAATIAHEASHDIAERILDVLEKSAYPCTRLVRVAGGNANFTYRGFLKTRRKSQETTDGTIIIKHAEPYVATNPSWALDARRICYEYFMLSRLSGKHGTKTADYIVRTPKVLSRSHSLPELGLRHTMILEDLPDSMTLKAYLSRHGDDLDLEDALRLGHALGTWLIRFHEWMDAENEGAAALRSKLAGNQGMGEAREGLYIGSYRASMKEFPDIAWPDEGTLEAVESSVKNVCRNGGQGIHGDFWTGNMILKEEPLTARTPGIDPPIEIFILDFEVSHLGSRAQDVAQCLAELYMVYHFFDARSPLEVMRGITEAYGFYAEDENVSLQTVMHFGIHLVVIPWRYGWPAGEKLQACVEYGNECLVRGWKRDKEWFYKGPLRFLFPV